MKLRKWAGALSFIALSGGLGWAYSLDLIKRSELSVPISQSQFDANLTAIENFAAAMGTMATQAASAVSITGGSITGITDLAVADGGTGASDAAGARTNFGLGALAVANTVGSSQIDDGSVAVGDLANLAGLSVLGRASNSTGVIAAVTAGGDNQVLRRNGTVAQFGAINLATSGAVGTSVLLPANGGTGDAGTLSGLRKANTTSADTAATAGTDYYAPGSTDVAVADGGTGSSTASAARTALGVPALTDRPIAVNLSFFPPQSSNATVDVRSGGSTPAESFLVWNYDASSDECLDGFGVLGPAGLTASTNVTLRFYWAAASATTGNVMWYGGFRNLASNDLDTSETYSTQATSAQAASGTNGIMTSTTLAFTSSQIDSLVAGQPFVFRLCRDADNASDTMTGDAQVLESTILLTEG